MSWTPTKQVLDAVPIIENLLNYVEEYAGDAVAWANGGDEITWTVGDESGTGFAELYSNAAGRLNTIFPSLMVLDHRVETDLTGDILLSGVEMTLEATLDGFNADDLTLTARKYSVALESLLSNVTAEDLTAGMRTTTNATLFEIDTRFDILRGHSQQANAFLQIFQTKVLYRFDTAAF